MPYDFLADVVVLEVSQFGPDALGGYLADMGARVIKIEPPRGGDPIRHAGAIAVGGEDGVGYLHLRWNRGKQSIVIDLSTEEGVAEFEQLVPHADIVIEGMRAGVMNRLGIGYEHLRTINPRVIFCSLSGMGSSGPYAKMASHGPSFDSFAGLGAPTGNDISKYGATQPVAVGMYAYGLFAAFGVMSALHRARRTGEGALIEVAAAECSAHWLPEAVDPLLNADLNFDRPGFKDGSGRMRLWARMENYRCRDGKLVYLMTLTDKSWQSLLQIIDRPDLDTLYKRVPQSGFEDEHIAAELAAIFLTRDRAEWLALFARANVAALPVNSFEDLVADPHFQARNNLYSTRLADGRAITLTSTPIHVPGQEFDMPLAPELGEHDAVIRAEFGIRGRREP